MQGSITYDIESRGFDDTSTFPIAYTQNVPDPYAGLNRKQRRHAMASEGRAARKAAKRRG